MNLKPMTECSKCKTNVGVLYLCNHCNEEFCLNHINKAESELLCDGCFQGHPENPDSERVNEDGDQDNGMQLNGGEDGGE